MAPIEGFKDKFRECSERLEAELTSPSMRRDIAARFVVIWTLLTRIPLPQKWWPETMPPGNRVPTPEESVMCGRHLQTQIMLINPMLIVLLGNTPTRWMLQTTEGITKLRGRWFEWRGAAVMPMFHPSYLLRNASSKEGSPKHLTWIDIQEVKRQWEAVKRTGTLDSVKFG